MMMMSLMRDAWNHSNGNERMKWQESIKKGISWCEQKKLGDKNLDEFYLQIDVVLSKNGLQDERNGVIEQGW